MPKFILQGRDDPRIAKLDEFTIAYIEAAFFTASDDLGHPSTLAVQQLADRTLARMAIDCAQFQRRAADVLPTCSCCIASAGHDFWLTRNGHGAGFWDGDWPEPAATTLDKLSKQFGSLDLYRGDDGRIHH